ncbi:alpha/beta hydrolase, partial [Streptomyces sp. WAC06614]
MAGSEGGASAVVQRFDVTGADGVRLAAWEFRESDTAPPRGATVPR